MNPFNDPSLPDEPDTDVPEHVERLFAQAMPTWERAVTKYLIKIGWMEAFQGATGEWRLRVPSTHTDAVMALSTRNGPLPSPDPS